MSIPPTYQPQIDRSLGRAYIVWKISAKPDMSSCGGRTSD